MITIEKNTSPVEKSNVLKTLKYKIEVSAKAFRALSSQIYSDPISAPIRELSTNAWDAQQQAGTIDRQFIVHLPNSLEPFFRIRDYGFGMSKEDIELIYCNYFKSTKTHTNSAIGCHGLGSKSPFCYTDSFIVTSYWRQDPNSEMGIKYAYAAFLENGEPTLAHLAEEKTSEHSGMEIEFAVKPEDFNSFSSKAKNIYRMFKVKPIIKGVTELDITDDTKYSFVGNGWAIKEPTATDRYMCTGASVAIMGNIAYSISNVVNMHQKFDEKYRTLVKCGIEVNFEIGELEITLSREELQYDERTIKALTLKFDLILKEIEVMVQNELNSQPTYWSACCLGKDYFWRFSQSFKNVIKHMNLTWNGKALKECFSIGEFCDKIYTFHWGTKRYNGIYKCRKEKVSYLSCERDIEFYEEDGTVDRVDSRIKKYVEENPKKTICVMTLPNLGIREKLIDEIGIQASDLKRVDSLPIPPRKQRVSVDSADLKLRKVYRFVDSAYGKSFWQLDRIDLSDKTETFYYVKVKNYTPTYEGMSTKLLHCLIQSMKNNCGFTSEVFGVSHQFSKIDKMENCVNFIEFAKKSLTDYISTLNIVELLDTSSEYLLFNSSVGDAFKEIVGKLKGMKVKGESISSETNQLINKIEECKVGHDKFKSLCVKSPDNDIPRILCTFLNMNIQKYGKTDSKMQSLINDFYAKYPLVRHIIENNTSFIGDTYMTEIIKYIKMADTIGFFMK